VVPVSFSRSNDLTRKSDTYAAEVVVRAPALLVAATTALGCWEAWHDSGSIAAAAAHGFLPYAVLAAILLSVALASGATAVPRRAGLAAVGLLAASACWAAASLEWSWVPSLARDEALLTLFYAVALAAPLVTLTTAPARLAALGAFTVVLGVFTAAVAVRIAFSPHAQGLFRFGRLYFPITYANAQGALFALAAWPALLLSARRPSALATRALALAAAAGCTAAALLAQSKGTTLGLGVSLVVVLACSPTRLRLVAPAAAVAAIDLAAFRPLTAPYREPTLAAVHGAGRAVLAAALAGLVAGAAIAYADRRVELSQRARRRVARALGAALVAAVLAGAAAFFASEPHPAAWGQAQWASFKHFDPNAGGTSHLSALGSNRYDFWRVALTEFRQHPLTGCGARCFGPAYLVLGRSTETPARAHSLPLELLAEQGIVGFALLIGALALIFVLLARATRAASITSTAALGAFAGWAVQSSVDWTWTFPALTAPLFALVGTGLAGAAVGGLRPAVPRLAAVPAALVALVLFAPPWLAQRLTDDALRGTSDPGASLRWARRLDPVSTAPIVAQAQLAASSGAQLRLLHEAAEREPRVLQTQYFYGSVLLNTGHRAEARAVFERALRLDPGNEAVERALRLAR
jgi:hypothetical protein